MVISAPPVVLDTSVVSIIYNQDPRAPFYEGQLAGQRPVVSFQTLEELWFGAFIARWGEKRRNDLSRHLDQYEVVWPGPELVDVCARLRSGRRSAGHALQLADAWVAATALLLRCPLAADDGDFADIPNLTLIRAPLKP